MRLSCRFCAGVLCMTVSLTLSCALPCYSSRGCSSCRQGGHCRTQPEGTRSPTTGVPPHHLHAACLSSPTLQCTACLPLCPVSWCTHLTTKLSHGHWPSPHWQKIAEQKAAEAKKELPEGWRRVESRSRKGEFVYENIHTEERQAWFPDAPAREELSAPPAPSMTAEEAKKEELKKKNAAALAARKYVVSMPMPLCPRSRPHCRVAPCPLCSKRLALTTDVSVCPLTLTLSSSCLAHSTLQGQGGCPQSQGGRASTPRRVDSDRIQVETWRDSV